MAYNLGYFADGLDISIEVSSRNDTSDLQRSLWCLNAVNYVGYQPNSDSPLYDEHSSISYRVEGVDPDGIPSVDFHGGPVGMNASHASIAGLKSILFEDVRRAYPVEALVLFLTDPQKTDQQKAIAIEEMTRRLADNLWIVPSDHPTSALNIAKWCVDQQEYLAFARSLVNGCLGWRYPMRRIEDLNSLARLLDYFKAPQVFWTALLGQYVDFAADDSLNQQLSLDAGVLPNLVELRRTTVNAKEGAFHRFCADHGLPNHDTVMRQLLEALALEESPNANSFQGDGSYVPEDYASWLTKEAFQMRHPWFVMLKSHEQSFVRNGDTAFVACVTEDFSFGCAQWWRCVESVLRRKLIQPLGRLVDANPDWVSSDEAFARRRSDEWEWESLFVRELPNPRRRLKFSLTQMLQVLESCIKDNKKQFRSESEVRRNCVEYIGSKLQDFHWVMGELDEVADFRSVMMPRIFKQETIQAFRNAASHDNPMEFEQAVVGRLLAIRILDFMHYPRYCVNEKLEELKAELRDLKENASQ